MEVFAKMGKDYVTIDDLRKLNNPDLIPKKFRIIYNTLFRTGMRPGELMKITPKDFHIEYDDQNEKRYYIDLKTQKNKQTNELTPVNIQDYTDIVDYIKQNNIKNNQFVFGSKRYKYLKVTSVSWLGRKLREHLKLVGIDKDITPHSFRAGFVTYMLDQGKSYDEISNVTRHQNVTVMRKHYDKRYKKRASDIVSSIKIF